MKQQNMEKYYMVEEEAIEEAVEVAIATLGVMGNVLPVRKKLPELHDVLVAAGPFGEIWYGDVERGDVQELANKLSCEILVYDRSRLGGVQFTAYPNN